MKKEWWFIVVIIMCLSFSGCYKGKLEEVKNVNIELKSEIEKLDKEKIVLKTEIEELKKDNTKLKETLAPFLKAQEEYLNKLKRDPAYAVFTDAEYRYMNAVFENISVEMQYEIMKRFKFKKYSDFLVLNLDKKVIILQKLLKELGLSDRLFKSAFLDQYFGLNAAMSEKVIDYKTPKLEEDK
ncbi:MAG TPA: hypothetical protein ENN73_01050 [Firmicutes bacterium]|nr:hypothetical protein [Bacillota bacterium]